MFEVQRADASIDQNREAFSESRKDSVKLASAYAEKDKQLLVRIFQAFVYRTRLAPSYKQWKN